MVRKTSLLVIERKNTDFPLFSAALRQQGMNVETVRSGSEALEYLRLGLSPDVIVVNAATLRTNGIRICQSLRETDRQRPIVLIIKPEYRTGKIEADTVLTLPFTAKKLVNRIHYLLPPDGQGVNQVGPICLDPTTGVVQCLGKQSRLTPRLVKLLNTLLEHRGEAIERKTLFSLVWETDYTEDTRTLDVHVSWLRQAIEPEPQHPRFLKTVRGVGYRLDV